MYGNTQSMDTKNQELVDLLARCALRDQKALKILYDRVSGYLNAVAFRMLKSNDLASDVLQEAFVQIWENAGSYRPHMAQPLTWMTSITRYRALDRLDKEKRYAKRFQQTNGDDDPLDSAEACPTQAPDSDLQRSQLGKQIDACLSTLSEHARQSIRLAYLEGFSRDEIAEKLNTNANTVKSWLRRGSERLKKCLETKI